jgi:thiamine-monophosphate kinase
MGTIADLGEFGLIARLTQGWPAHPDVLLGVGDDAAILDVGNADEVLVATCDAQVEGTHFRLDRATPQEIGRRALAVNLSDIAAMGATPRWALISLLLPPTFAVAVLDGLYAGLRAEAEAAGVALVGGNVARLAERLVVDITLLGLGHRGHLLRRDGARPGNVLMVTGTLGTAAAGLRLMATSTWQTRLSADVAAPLLAAQRLPTARLAAGQWLTLHGATAALDTSDGLAADLAHLCEASGVGAQIMLDALPIRPETRLAAEALGEAATDLALFGGEDYELLFTVPAELAATCATDLFAATGTPATIIGTIQAERGLRAERDGQIGPLAPGGWDHLRAS